MAPHQTRWRQVTQGDREAFEEFYLCQLPRLRSYLRVYLGSQEAAEDIAQEAFLQLWKHPNGFDPSRSGLRTYLFTIARHRAADWWRHNSPETEKRSSPARPEAETTALMGDLLARLDADNRGLLWLREVEGYSYDELAAMLKVPIGTVKSRLFAARQRLREIWKQR